MSHTVWRGDFVEAVVEQGWEYVRRASDMGAAVIYAVTDSNELILVEQHRIPLGRTSIELPAGIVGDENASETATETARRELEEETGFRAGRLLDLGTFVTSPGLANERFTLFRAEDLSRVGSGGGVSGEDITVHIVPLRDLPTFVQHARRRGADIDKILAGLLLRPL